MFLTGYITDDLEPIVKSLFVRGKFNKKIPVVSLLDTGFNGELALPQHIYKDCDLKELGIKTFELANGQLSTQTIYRAFLCINNKIYPVEATFTSSKIALIGMEMIRNKIATFNLKTSKLYVKN